MVGRKMCSGSWELGSTVLWKWKAGRSLSISFWVEHTDPCAAHFCQDLGEFQTCRKYLILLQTPRTEMHNRQWVYPEKQETLETSPCVFIFLSNTGTGITWKTDLKLWLSSMYRTVKKRDQTNQFTERWRKNPFAQLQIKTLGFTFF